MTDFSYTILEYINNAVRRMNARPLNLGGVSASGGGAGAPPGGFVGYLPQTRVAYDYTELASSGLPASGWSLLDNLNHIRYRLDVIESGGGAVLTFLNLTDTPSTYAGQTGKAVVVNATEDGLIFSTISGGLSSITIKDEGIEISDEITVIDFRGLPVTVTQDGTTAIVTISGTGSSSESLLFYHEDLTEQIDGIDGSFTLLEPTDGKFLAVYFNGIRQGTTFYTVSGQSLVLDFTPISGDTLGVDYIPYSGFIVPSGVVGDSLPDQTGHAGEFLTTDGYTASWTPVSSFGNIDGGSASSVYGGTTILDGGDSS